MRPLHGLALHGPAPTGDPGMSTDDLLAAVIARLDAAEAVAAERHAEMLAAVREAEDAASCAGLDVEALSKRFGEWIDPVYNYGD